MSVDSLPIATEMPSRSGGLAYLAGSYAHEHRSRMVSSNLRIALFARWQVPIEGAKILGITLNNYII